MSDYYDLLGVDRDADAETIEAAFRERLRELHPDRDDSSATEAVVRLKRARAVLTDPASRKDYDRLGHRRFCERERGRQAASVDLRSTADDRSVTGQSRSHTRPRETAVGRSRAQTPQRGRSAGGSGTDTSSAGEQAAPGDAGAHSGTDVRNGTTEQAEESPADTFPTNVGQSDRFGDEGLAADDLVDVVAIDDLLEETNVGSVDPTQLLGDDSDDAAPRESTGEQSAEDEQSAELEAVVQLDELLEETNVGSVDPKQLLSDTGTGEESDPEQSRTDAGTPRGGRRRDR